MPGVLLGEAGGLGEGGGEVINAGRISKESVVGGDAGEREHGCVGHFLLVGVVLSTVG